MLSLRLKMFHQVALKTFENAVVCLLDSFTEHSLLCFASTAIINHFSWLVSLCCLVILFCLVSLYCVVISCCLISLWVNWVYLQLFYKLRCWYWRIFLQYQNNTSYQYQYQDRCIPYENY